MVNNTQLATSESGHSHTLATAFEANGVDWAGQIINIGTLFAFLLVALGIPVLRKRYPGAAKFKTPLVPLVPILSALCTVWLMINLSMETWLRFVIWMALGLIMYFVYSRKHSVLETGEVTPAENENPTHFGHREGPIGKIPMGPSAVSRGLLASFSLKEEDDARPR